PPLVPGCVVGVLTARETEVLELVAAGARNGDIAARLAISLTTVKTHVRNIMLKLGVDNRSQVIAAYFNAGTAPRPAPSPANEG
ncbi:MAG TPA: helix-turn-helix transcriptional regulator, partial [Rugosimonospora sp.]|nr:helix-turn-helix transcriptional regulator [Rugosimonospora sp.]